MTNNKRTKSDQEENLTNIPSPVSSQDNTEPEIKAQVIPPHKKQRLGTQEKADDEFVYSSFAQEDEVLPVIKARRLDSLSRLLQGTSKCAAVCFDGEKLLISSNILSTGTRDEKGKNQNRDLILDVMNYLSQVARGEENLEEARKDILKKAAFPYIGGIIVNHKFEQETNNLVGYTINNEVELTTLSIADVARHAGIKKTKQGHGDFLGNAPIAIDRLKKDLENIEKDIKEIRNQKAEERSENDQNFLSAFSQSNSHLDVRRSHEPEVSMIMVDDNTKEKNTYTGRVRNREMKPLEQNQAYGFELLHTNGYGKGDVHAEMQIAQRLIDKQITEEDKIKGKDIYIGISMLCCLNCHAAIESINLVNAGKTMEHFKSSKEKDNKNRIYESPIKIHSMFLAEQEEVAVEVNVKSYFVIAHRGDHDQSFTDGWGRPPFMGKAPRGNKAAETLYGQRYKDILDIITKNNPKAIMYMSDSERSDRDKEKKPRAEFIEALSTQKIIEYFNKITTVKEAEELQIALNKKHEWLVHSKTSSIAESIQPVVVKIEDNAITKYKDLGYWYSDRDINDISGQLIKNINSSSSKNLKFITFGSTEAASSGGFNQFIMNFLTDNTNNSSPETLVGIYHIDNNHWINFVLEPDDSGKYVISYKDSLGKQYPNFETHLKDIFKKFDPNLQDKDIPISQLDIDAQTGEAKKDQLETDSCGVFALKNLEIIGNHLAKGEKLSTIPSYYNSENHNDKKAHDEVNLATREEFALTCAHAKKEQAIEQLKNIKSKQITVEKLNEQKQLELTAINSVSENIKEAQIGKAEIVSVPEDNREKFGAYFYSVTVHNQDNLDIYEIIKKLFEDKKLTENIDYVIDPSNEESRKKLAIYPKIKIDFTSKLVENLQENNKELPNINQDKIILSNSEIYDQVFKFMELPEEFKAKLEKELNLFSNEQKIDELQPEFEDLVQNDTDFMSEIERFRKGGEFSEEKLEKLILLLDENKNIFNQSSKLSDFLFNENINNLDRLTVFQGLADKCNFEQYIAPGYDADPEKNSQSPASSPDNSSDSPDEGRSKNSYTSDDQNLTHAEKYLSSKGEGRSI